MKNLGDKLKEAREAMSLSVRDAADATRLRADIINNMESGKFDYDLPEIYKRGFLRIYSAFLKLDTPSILAEYESLTRTVSRDDSAFRHILQRSVHRDNSSVSAYPERAAAIESRYGDEAEEDSASGKSGDDSLRYMKLGSLFLGMILAALVIVLIVSLLVKCGDSSLEENPDIASVASPNQLSAVDVSVPVSATPAVDGKKKLHLVVIAAEDTYVIAYPENDEQKRFMSGPMQKGERREFDSEVPIILQVTDAERIKLERNSKAIDLGNIRGLKRFRITPQ